MKKLIYSSLVLMLLFVTSCQDEKLDPLQTNTVKKGNLLALRGAALTAVYVDGKPVAETFPRIATSTEKMVFDAEYLSSDPNSLSSVDVYVLKRTGSADEKVLVKNVPFSEFKKDGKYPNPWVTITLTLPELISKLGLNATFPLSSATINALLTTYKSGIPIRCDLNLTDGSKALSDYVTAAGLFQSNQFYPAQILSYTVTDYCIYNASDWQGSYDAAEIYPSGFVYDTYSSAPTLTQDATNPDKFTLDNYWDEGGSIYMIFSPSTGPTNQKVTIPVQNLIGGASGGSITKETTGNYDQCKKTIVINVEYTTAAGAANPFRYQLKKK